FHKQAILNAFEDFHNHSCLTFVPKTTETHWIKFIKGIGCWSYIGRGYSSPGPQTLSLGSGCYSKGVVIHEILHALGFQHEQSRPDRDRYVEIFWENIIESETHNFNKYSHAYLDVLGVQYDLESVMHYGIQSFSKNNKDTIRAISGANIGQRDGFSKTDIIKLNSLYNCHLRGVGWSAWSGFSPCTKDCKKKRQRYCFSSKLEDCPGVSSHGVETQYSPCSTDDCYAPIDGHWGRWSSWSGCSKNCSMGFRSRTRTCTDPSPLHSGKYCTGIAKEQQDCFVKSTCKPDNCEFTSGSYCHWVRNRNLNYHWQTHKGETKTPATGPNGDHTSGLDYYIYAEASVPATPNDIALLTSKQFPPSQCRCMTWYYSMYGKTMGELSVYIKDDRGSRRKLWSKKGDQGSKWISGEATISNVSSTDYQVEFEAIRGPSYHADIALDDIYFRETPCGAERLGCFNDRYGRALPDLIVNLRDKIDWHDMQKTVRECACTAHEQGYKYFAVQFYGECWGSRDFIAYDKYGASDDCVSGVGKDFTNFVYKFTD
ncbi:astacin-like metalloendopeptidase, partial [Paramuricea clavata]